MNRTRVVVALGVSQTLAWGSTYYLPAILAVPMAMELGLSTGKVFAAFSSALVVSALLGPAVGRRIDRFGGRDVLAASSLVFALGLVLLGLADGLMMLWAGWLVIGVGMGMGLYEAAFSTLAGLYGREARGPITGITLLAGFASSVCWPITGWLDAEFGWQNACFTWAAMHLLLGLPLNRLLIPFGIQPPQPHSDAAATEAESTWLPMALLTFVFAVTWIISTAMAAHLPWLLQIAGLSPAAAIAAAALVGPAQVAARLLEFSLLRRFHPLLSAKLAAVAHPLGALGVMTLGAPLATLFVLLHGAGNGILTIAKGTLPLAIFGPHGYGLRQGVLMVPARFGQALAPLAFALLIERFGTQALLFSSALGLLAVVALLVLQTHALKEAT
ncbi:MFS transporter [Billgrantia gudaonensis]|uniref:Predicted arabinose efflux permease, MFS family n=1 Tax=Billgrantia gudaonensis TaxID=376427 RepID=A0A1G8R5I5_9GAMM|nr:MFS transporter [Halomonas gudaonensis]SDJ12103.1 Predicted arabinose efflux permease, MFS family [Halomonas gudaonensis]